MEKNSKNYQLVAWTENGNVRMIPSLALESECELLDELCTLTTEFHTKQDARDRHGRFTMTPQEEIEARLALSDAYEKLAGFYLAKGAIRDGYWALDRAAEWCADCSDGLWIYDENSFYPAVPLVRRFYAIHERIISLIREYPRLRLLYEGSYLEKDFLTFSQDRRLS